MSFGFSPSDIVALISIVSKTYQGWKKACGEYADVTTSLDSLLIIIKRIEDESKRPGSTLIRSDQDALDLKDILSNTTPTVRELHAVVERYKSLGLGKSRERNWEKIRFGVKDLKDVRSKLNEHTSALSTYLSTVGLSSLTRIEQSLEKLPQIRQTVDALAAEIRAGRREGTIMTTYEDDEKDVWKQFRRELVSEGMKSGVIHKYKPQIRAYLRLLAERGDLEEQPPAQWTSEAVGTTNRPDYQPPAAAQRKLATELKPVQMQGNASGPLGVKATTSTKSPTLTEARVEDMNGTPALARDEGTTQSKVPSTIPAMAAEAIGVGDMANCHADKPMARADVLGVSELLGATLAAHGAANASVELSDSECGVESTPSIETGPPGGPGHADERLRRYAYVEDYDSGASDNDTGTQSPVPVSTTLPGSPIHAVSSPPGVADARCRTDENTLGSAHAADKDSALSDDNRGTRRVDATYPGLPVGPPNEVTPPSESLETSSRYKQRPSNLAYDDTSATYLRYVHEMSPPLTKENLASLRHSSTKAGVLQAEVTYPVYGGRVCEPRLDRAKSHERLSIRESPAFQIRSNSACSLSNVSGEDEHGRDSAHTSEFPDSFANGRHSFPPYDDTNRTKGWHCLELPWRTAELEVPYPVVRPRDAVWDEYPIDQDVFWDHIDLDRYLSLEDVAPNDAPEGCHCEGQDNPHTEGRAQGDEPPSTLPRFTVEEVVKLHDRALAAAEPYLKKNHHSPASGRLRRPAAEVGRTAGQPSTWLKKLPRPFFPRVDVKYLDVETLIHYKLPYEHDPNDSKFIVILCDMTRREVNVLFEHTHMLRQAEKPMTSNPGSRAWTWSSTVKR